MLLLADGLREVDPFGVAQLRRVVVTHEVGEARLLKVKLGLLPVGLAAAAPADEPLHAEAGEPQDVERRREGHPLVLVLDDNVDALESAVERRFRLDNVVRVGHLGDHQVDDEDGREEQVKPQQRHGELGEPAIVAERVIDGVDVKIAVECPHAEKDGAAPVLLVEGELRRERGEGEAACEDEYEEERHDGARLAHHPEEHPDHHTKVLVDRERLEEAHHDKDGREGEQALHQLHR
mmetsp:Transcript_45597/g.126522  ORF Transcript_45597/g.126522 Transcript_45597/m.126522 type:complete len:236 (-) Transcript_45597:474-1181(-)|eukprot:6531466-Prymnesium_polylepis.1